MSTLFHDAEPLFNRLLSLLENPVLDHLDYTGELSDTAHHAYIVINANMCQDTTICRECAHHRDFIFSMLPLLDRLHDDHSTHSVFSDKLEPFGKTVKTVLERIKTLDPN